MAAPVEALLAAFLREQSGMATEYGKADCCLLLSDWWQCVHGVDPAAHLRGTYASKAECDLMLAARGGIYEVVRRIAVSVGAKPSADGAGVGDFGLAAIAGWPRGFIRTERGRLAVRSEARGLAFSRGIILQAWSIQ